MSELDLSKISFLKPLNADYDDNLINYFIEFGDFKKLLTKKKFIVSGIIGSGKSAIKKYIVYKREKDHKMSICLDKTYSISLKDLKTSNRAGIENKIKGYLSEIILHHILNCPLINKNQKKELKKLTSDVPFIGKLAKSVKVSTVVEVALKDLFPESKKGNLLRVIDKRVIEQVKNILGDKDIWFFIDDVDDIFSSTDEENSQKFIEGLLSAVGDLNYEYKKNIHIVILLPSEKHEELKEQFIGLDKLREYIWKIEWTSRDLELLLLERIKWAIGRHKKKKNWEYWTLMFNFKNETSVNKYRDYIFERSINGPRDMLEMLERAREKAVSKGNKKIGVSHIKEIEPDYGGEKLSDVTRNYKVKYKDITHVIDRLFRDTCQIYTRKDLEKQIKNKLLLNKYAREDFGHLLWLKTSTSYSFIEILYTVGIIGYYNKSKRKYIYVLEKSRPDKIIFNSGETKLKVHSAFIKHLSLK